MQTEAGKAKSILFQNSGFKVDTSDDSKFILENGNTGNADNQIKMSEIATISQILLILTKIFQVIIITLVLKLQVLRKEQKLHL